MRATRFVAALLMILAGILHLLAYVKEPQDPHVLIMFAFGIIYPATGVLLFKNWKFVPLLGIIFPVTGMGIGIFVIGTKAMNPMLGIMFAIDLIVVLCCMTLLCYRKK